MARARSLTNARYHAVALDIWSVFVRFGRGSGIRTRGTFALPLSKRLPSATRPSLWTPNLALWMAGAEGFEPYADGTWKPADTTNADPIIHNNKTPPSTKPGGVRLRDVQDL